MDSEEEALDYKLSPNTIRALLLQRDYSDGYGLYDPSSPSHNPKNLVVNEVAWDSSSDIVPKVDGNDESFLPSSRPSHPPSPPLIFPIPSPSVASQRSKQPEGVSYTRKPKKCIKEKGDNISMVVGEDIVVKEVSNFYGNTPMGSFCGNK